VTDTSEITDCVKAREKSSTVTRFQLPHRVEPISFHRWGRPNLKALSLSSEWRQVVPADISRNDNREWRANILMDSREKLTPFANKLKMTRNLNIQDNGSEINLPVPRQHSYGQVVPPYPHSEAVAAAAPRTANCFARNSSNRGGNGKTISESIKKRRSRPAGRAGIR
jgi:hypothetical protein